MRDKKASSSENKYHGEIGYFLIAEKVFNESSKKNTTAYTNKQQAKLERQVVCRLHLEHIGVSAFFDGSQSFFIQEFSHEYGNDGH